MDDKKIKSKGLGTLFGQPMREVSIELSPEAKAELDTLKKELKIDGISDTIRGGPSVADWFKCAEEKNCKGCKKMIEALFVGKIYEESKKSWEDAKRNKTKKIPQT